MDDDPSKKKEGEPRRHFQFGRDFVLPPNSSIYIPETKESQKEPANYPTTVNVQSWLPVNVKRDRLIAFLTAIAAIISAFGLYVLIKYTQAAFQQVSQTQIANWLARQSAIDAGALAGRANKTAINSDRPWIGMHLNAENWGTDKPFKLHVIFVNSGKRPAMLLSSYLNSDTLASCPAKPIYKPGPIKIHSRGLVLPNQTASNSNPFPWTSAEFTKQMTARTDSFYIFATTTYEDVLTHAIHWTRACWQFVPGFENQGNGFVSCPCYNEVDVPQEDKPQN
jgi:hypothetical protein